MRLFVAIRPTEEVVENINRYILQLSSKMSGVKWVEKENLHVTLKFLGDVDFKDFDIFKGRLADSLSSEGQFIVAFNEVGAFPSLRMAKTLWIKAEDSGQLRRISEIIDKESRNIACRADNKFHPHLTIGRVKEADFKFSEDVKKDFGKSVIEEISIIESRLTPRGPIYTDLAKIKLK